jgi:transcriptional regulator with GAF, ATPase, and Fis domain
MAGSTTAPQAVVSTTPRETPDRVLTAAELADLERANIRRALAACGGKIAGDSGAARLLGIPPTTLSSRMKALQVSRD